MRFAANEFAMYVLRRRMWRLGRNCDETEKTILVKFCGSAVLFLAGAYFLPMWTAWGICDNTAGDGVC